MNKFVIGGVLTILASAVVSVAAILIGVVFLVLILVPPSQSGCGGPAPTASPMDQSEFVLTSSIGEELPITAKQLENATRVLNGAIEMGATDREILILFMTALVESKLHLYASSVVPETLNYPHDLVGSDHDSIGVIQQRLSMGYGTIEELMDPAYNAKAFIGGPTGPNAGSPPGVRDIVGGETMSNGVVAQKVQVSAHPERYDYWEEAAKVLISKLGVPTGVTEPRECPSAPAGPGNGGGGVFPPEFPIVISDGVGPRDAPTAGASSWHPALDFDAACGTPVLATRPGVVTTRSGYWLGITTDDGTEVAYLHMSMADVPVQLGDRVEVGQQIGAVGDEGPSTGCHLDFRVNAAGSTDPAVQALPDLSERGGPDGYVDPIEYMRLYGVELVPAA